MTAGDGATTDFGDEERLRRALDRTPRCPTLFRSAAACLHVPANLTREPAKHEARKRRASERHAVGCCEELGCIGLPLL
jgi:hypothetical protein